MMIDKSSQRREAERWCGGGQRSRDDYGKIMEHKGTGGNSS